MINWLIDLINPKEYIFENNSGWIHVSQLSKKKSAINIKKNSILYKNSTIYSQPIAKLEIGRLVLVTKCKKNWCKISSGKFDGWIFKNSLWGKINKFEWYQFIIFLLALQIL